MHLERSEAAVHLFANQVDPAKVVEPGESIGQNARMDGTQLARPARLQHTGDQPARLLLEADAQGWTSIGRSRRLADSPAGFEFNLDIVRAKVKFTDLHWQPAPTAAAHQQGDELALKESANRGFRM